MEMWKFSMEIAFKLINVPSFLQEKYMSKINTKEAKPKQIRSTAKNIKYEPILSDLVVCCHLPRP